MASLRAKTWGVLAGNASGPLPLTVNLFILALIFLNVLAVALETVEAVALPYQHAFTSFEAVSVAVFSVEYLLRWWSCVEDEEYRHPIKGRLRWMISPMAAVDVLAVAPFYLAFWTLDMRFLRALRLMRLFRLLKIGRYARSLRLMGRVLRAKKEELFISMFVLCLCLIVAASVVHYAEKDQQPDKFGSIPQAMWWSVATLSTVGYGDVYPITTLGKVCAAIIAISGIGLFGLPAGILASGFVDAIDEEQRQRRREEQTGGAGPTMACPHCGEDIRITLN